MKVAITLNTSWNIYNFRMGLVRKLLANGHQVHAIAPRDKYTEMLIQAGCTFSAITLSNTGSNPFSDLNLLFQLRKIYQDERPDIILHFTIKPNIYGTLAAKTLQIPTINNVSGLGTVFMSNGLSSLVAKMLYKCSFSSASLVFFQNKDDREKFLSEIPLPSLNTDLLPGSGVDLVHFRPMPLNDAGQITFLMMARIIIDKGINEFLEAANITRTRYPNARFQLLGKLDPAHKRGIAKNVIDKAVAAGIIEYLGVADDVRPLIEKATCIVLPSYSEGTPRTLLEAAALARPVITTDVPGCREVVIHENTGLLCEVMNATDLANKMSVCCEMKIDQLEQWGKNGRAFVKKKFDEQLVIDQYMKHIEYYDSNTHE